MHHFRDECLVDESRPPVEHVALFDEAQRAWNMEQTSGLHAPKEKAAYFDLSEPEFLISCLDRHPDWAVVVCLVGGGQEINTGEAGISEWIDSLMRSFPHWSVYISSRLTTASTRPGRRWNGSRRGRTSSPRRPSPVRFDAVVPRGERLDCS